MKKNIFMFCVVLCAAIIATGLTGCKKDTPADQPDAPKGMTEILTQTVSDAEEIASIQTQCPVMGGEINKDIFVEYQGKKVYFCCPPCKEKFNADPEKYLSKLPQFEK